jgi:hypothetical protein
VRCPRCGNDNSEDNRFCGMCGARLLPAPAVVTSAPVAVASSPAQAPVMRSSTPLSAAAAAPARPQVVTPPQPSPPVSEDSPFISGPSFLGLNDPAPRKRASLSADPHSSSNSSNLDYLLDDEEAPKRGSAGKFALILLMLALAAGFGYVRFKVLRPRPFKAPVAVAQDSAPTSTTPPSSDTTTVPIPAPAQPAAQAAAQPAADSSSPNNPLAAAATPDFANPPASTAPAQADAAPSGDASNSSPDSPAATEPADKEPAEEPTAAAPDIPPAPSPKPKRAAVAPAPKPHAGITPTGSVDSVSEAQNYIYGRGVSQDCERGMRLLKPAAAQANPKAMIEMGALYSAGLCAPHDLPTAYRWFAMALRKDPENQSVQADLQKLWGEMTQPERQLAIKLSQ